MNIGLLGFGVVGRGVYDMLAGRDDIRAAWVLCRRDLGELTARTTYEMQDILDDPAVDTVVEVMGGLHPAYEYVAAALRAGKNVVSSNKYLMCRYYDELTALAKEHGAALRCTAAVGGGIPWLTNLEKAAHANHISRVWGILNGTTNYIMDAMHGSDADFADVLAHAKSIECLIRGLNPWPSAYTDWNGKVMKIWEAGVLDENTDAKPGTIVKVEKDSFSVQTGDGLLKVLALQIPGKKRMEADAFLRGYQIETGCELSSQMIKNC